MHSEILASAVSFADAPKQGERRRRAFPKPLAVSRARSVPVAPNAALADPVPASILRSGVTPEREALVRRLVERLLDALEGQPADATQRISETIQRSLATELSGLCTPPPIPPCRQTAGLGRAELARITEYIDRHIDRSIELADLAALIQVSRFHFSRLFKRSTGTTALAFVEARRILHAQRLLTETDLPLAEIALMTGFSDQSHFTRRFRERLGSTPAAFAREKGRRRSAQRQG